MNERKLIIYLMTICKAYNSRDIGDVGWVLGVKSPADGLTEINVSAFCDKSCQLESLSHQSIEELDLTAVDKMPNNIWTFNTWI